MAALFRPFANTPDEVLLNVLSMVEPTDHLSAKLVCRKFLRCAYIIDTAMFTLAQAASCHAAIEAKLPRNRALVCCCCTRCGRVKNTSQFTDNQATRTKKRRTCIACGIRRRRYTRKCMPSVGRETKIPCWVCLQPKPLYEKWELKSVEVTMVTNLYLGNGICCEDCLESTLRSVTFPPPTLHDFFSLIAGCRVRFPTMQQRNQEIARLHADPRNEWRWKIEGV